MSLLTTSVNTYSRDHELFRFPACKLALFIITTPIPRMTTSKIMLMIITLMLSRFTMKFIVFLLSLSDIRSLSQEKRDVNTFFIFFQYFFSIFMHFCVNYFVSINTFSIILLSNTFILFKLQTCILLFNKI